jgi:putative transposase
MPRIARVIVPKMPHHVTQRGNMRADVFHSDPDRQKYLSLLAKYAAIHEVRIWAYCLMTNHVHFVAVPAGDESLGRGFRDTHQAYAAWFNKRLGQVGHLWQGQFYSCVLDDAHMWSAVRYVERNPVRAGLVSRAEDWPWSSAAAHCGRRSDTLLSRIEMPWPVSDWSAYLGQDDEAEVEILRSQTHTGRPCGTVGFIERLEGLLGRRLRPAKRGRKPKQSAGDQP